MTAATYFRTNPQPAAPVVVVDIDSTLADTRHRRHAAPQGDAKKVLANWEPYSLACVGDTPISGMVKLTQLLWGPYLVFLLSARNGVALPQSIEWMTRYGVSYDLMRLRGADEIEPDSPSAWKIGVMRGWQRQGFNLSLYIDDWAATAQDVYDELGIPFIVPTPPGDRHQPGY